jgi:hypothetical protein
MCDVIEQSPGCSQSATSNGTKNNDPLEAIVFIGLSERLSLLGWGGKQVEVGAMLGVRSRRHQGRNAN